MPIVCQVLLFAPLDYDNSNNVISVYLSSSYFDEYEFYYLQSRYYNSEVGRFLNGDSLSTTGQGFVGNNMFAYCNNNPILLNDPNGQVAVNFFLDAFMGDGNKRIYDNKSGFAKALKKSTAVNNKFDEQVQKLKATGAKRSYKKSKVKVYENETINDKDLGLTVGQAHYTMTVTKETRMVGLLKKTEQTRYVAEVTMWDSYDFTEWFPGHSFGAVMNNIAAVGQFVGVIVPYDWEVSFTMKTKWE